jgi:hypothetical protein
MTLLYSEDAHQPQDPRVPRVRMRHDRITLTGRDDDENDDGWRVRALSLRLSLSDSDLSVRVSRQQ